MLNRAFLVLTGEKSVQRKYVIIPVVAITLILVFIRISGLRANETSSITNGGTETIVIEEKRPEPSTDVKRLFTHIINGDSSGRWKIPATEPLQGSIFPFKRVIAFYGNLYSKQMGILGELPKPEVLAKLQQVVNEWKKADTVMDVIPALHYIAVTAQCLPGKAGKYRLRMPFSQIDSVLKMAEQINAIVFIDIQIGLGTLQEEIPELEKYLKLPNVHLGIDPEFSMKGGQKPGAVIGEFHASDINYATGYLAKLVKENGIPPKVLVIHRFTQPMVKNYKEFKIRPEVQIVMHMDGWGHPENKIGTYNHFISREPVEFTGFKIFYKNDMKNNGRLLTPKELVKLKPQPVYIQYQ